MGIRNLWEIEWLKICFIHGILCMKKSLTNKMFYFMVPQISEDAIWWIIYSLYCEYIEYSVIKRSFIQRPIKITFGRAQLPLKFFRASPSVTVPKIGIYFCSARHFSYSNWHMPFQISIIVQPNRHSICAYDFFMSQLWKLVMGWITLECNICPGLHLDWNVLNLIV